MGTWPDFFRRVIAVDVAMERVTLDTVWQYANPLPDVPTDGEDDVLTKWLAQIKPMLDLLHQSGTRLYYGHRDVIYVTKGNGRQRTTFALYRGHVESADELRVSEPIYWANLEMLLMTWKRGQKGWKKSRDMLCDHLAHTIAQEKTRAINDFNGAVAVSTDGKKIISSPWVIVRGRNGEPNRLFTADDFAGNPFLRDKRVLNGDSYDVYYPDGKVSEEFMLGIMQGLARKIALSPEFDWQGSPGKQQRVPVLRLVHSYPKIYQELTEIFITSSQPPGGMPDGGIPLDPNLVL